MEFVNIVSKKLQRCDLVVAFSEGELQIRFENMIDEISVTLLEECLVEQNILFQKNVIQQQQDNQIPSIIATQKLQNGINLIRFSKNNVESVYQLMRYIQVAQISKQILCKELFFNDFAILLPQSFFNSETLLQVKEFIKIYSGENVLNTDFNSLEQYVIVDEYEYCINILRKEHFSFTINWKNVKPTVQKIDNKLQFTEEKTQMIVVDFIKSPTIISKLMSSINDRIRVVRLNTCVVAKFDQCMFNKNFKFVEDLELLSLNQEQYVFSASRLKGIQLMQIQEHFTGLKRLVLENIAADCLKLKQIEELIIHHNTSDIFYVDLDSTCKLHTLIIQRVNAFQITEMQYLSQLQKLALFDVDILEKDFQGILDNAPNLRYLKVKDVHFINWELKIRNENLEYISLDSMEFEQEFSDIFQLEIYPKVKYFAFINCRMNIDYTLSCFNRFRNTEEFSLIDNTLGEHCKLDLSEMPYLKKLNIQCRQIKLYIHEQSILKQLDFSRTNITNIDKIMQSISQNLTNINFFNQILASNFINQINQLTFQNLSQLNLSYSKLNLQVDLSQIASQCANLSKIDLSNNQITAFKLVNEQSNLDEINLSYNNLTEVEIKLSKIKKLQLNNNALSSINKINIQEVIQLNLHRNQLTDISNIFSQINSIEVLDISANCVENLVIQNSASLKTLDASRNKISQISMKGKIENLDLSMNELAELNEVEADQNELSILNLIVKKNKLTTIPTLSHNTVISLDISNNLISSITKNLQNYPSLQSLSINRNQILICDPLFLCKSFPELEILQLSFNKIESIEYSTNNLPKLKVLNLSNNVIDSSDPLFSQPCALENIDLSFNNLICLTRYQINPQNNIKELRLRKNTLTDSSLSKVNNLNYLKILDISLNLFTDNIKFQHCLPKLHFLSLALNNLSNEGVSQVFENIETCFPELQEIDIMHTQGNKLPPIKSSTINFIYQDNNLFFDNLEENKQLYLKGVLFQS